MEIDYSDNKIEIEKELNHLDKFTIKFCSVLNKLNIKYVLLAGYVAILFGRNRSSEDIDIIIEKIEIDKWKELWNSLLEEFDCLNIGDYEEGYKEFLMRKSALRFAIKSTIIPNMEIKFYHNELDQWTLDNAQKVMLNNNELYISQFEIQICYKIYLGSRKDIEDAKYLYQIFKDKLNPGKMQYFINKLSIQDKVKRFLDETAQNKLEGT